MSRFNQISKTIQQVAISNPALDNELVWLNITNAGKKEIEYLRKEYNFNLSHLQASSAKAIAQRPSLSQGNGYLFLILQFPALKDGKIVPDEFDFFISETYLATIHNNVPHLNILFNLCKKDGSSFLACEFGSTAVLLYEVLEKLMLSCYSLIDKNSLEIQNVENMIFSPERKKAISEILALRLNIINFRKIMQNHKNIFKKLLEMKNHIVMNEEIIRFYKDLIEHSKTIWEILENQKEMVDILYETNESLLNYKLNDVIKTLTIFSVIVFPLTLFATIFSMNTVDGMPFIHGKHGFWIIIGFMALIAAGMLMFFKKKKWL